MLYINQQLFDLFTLGMNVLSELIFQQDVGGGGRETRLQ